MTEHCNDVHAFSKYRIKKLSKHPKASRQEKLKGERNARHGSTYVGMCEYVNMLLNPPGCK